ncbi:hypothetical protein NMY22_g516 [Coprinellus aureogranulatus]|nr:hypothetical protein NMY22_g516 [Coprinellus aureogranulatus]
MPLHELLLAPAFTPRRLARGRESNKGASYDPRHLKPGYMFGEGQGAWITLISDTRLSHLLPESPRSFWDVLFETRYQCIRTRKKHKASDDSGRNEEGVWLLIPQGGTPVPAPAILAGNPPTLYSMCAVTIQSVCYEHPEDEAAVGGSNVGSWRKAATH